MVHLAKTNPLFLTSTFRCYFFLNLLITDYEILPIYNSLLIYKHVKEMNYQNDKQECFMYIPTSIKVMLLSTPSGHQVDKWS
jgi:hypothetical protein